MKILYEDAQLLVCYKEAGLPVQSARVGTKDLESILKQYLREQNEDTAGHTEPYLGTVHRLDQPVEGVMAFAKTPQAAKLLSAQLTDGRMKKTYRAVTRMNERQPAGASAELQDYLLKDGRANLSKVVPEGTKGAKLAKLEYTVLGEAALEDGIRALLEIHLLTGRHHQIRVQLSHAGMPICGDRKYGAEAGGEQGQVREYGRAGGELPDSLADPEREDRRTEIPGDGHPRGQLALCAVSLELEHPKTGRRMRVTCEPEGVYFRDFRANCPETPRG